MKLVIRPILMIWMFAAPVWAQGFLWGVKGGVPLTTYFDTGAAFSPIAYSAGTRRYTVGASAERRIGHGLGLEVDALYHRFGYNSSVFLFVPTPSLSVFKTTTRGNSWDFPLLAKYRLGRRLSPFLDGGGVLRYVGPVRERGGGTVEDLFRGTTSAIVIDTSDPAELHKRFYPGLTAGSGVELRAGRLRVLPEVRYTHWMAHITGEHGPLLFTPHQVEALVGILF
jgi:hypothetical protein